MPGGGSVADENGAHDARGRGAPAVSDPARQPRRYDSPLRRERAAATRERIVLAGCELLRRSSIRDWRALTVRGAAQEAGVNERTVYRYFANERGLRDAVMHRLEQDAGVDLEGMRLGDIAGMAARILTHVSSYPRAARPPLDPTLREANDRQRQALHDAVAEQAGGWTEDERLAAAAMFDVLWSVASYERLVVDWQMDHAQAVGAITWVTALVERAVRDGLPPQGLDGGR